MLPLIADKLDKMHFGLIERARDHHISARQLCDFSLSSESPQSFLCK